MTKKTSLKDVTRKNLEAKEAFIHDDKPLKEDKGLEVKTKKARTVKKNIPSPDERIAVKKASCYIPVSLWIKFKTYELEMVKQGKSVNLNRLLVDLLEKKLKDY